MKRKIRNSTLIAALAFLLILTGVVALLKWRDDWVGEKLASYITRNLLSERGYSLSIERCDGNLDGHFVFNNVVVRYTGGRRVPFDLFRADVVDITFEPLSMMRGDFHGSALTVEGGELRAFGMGESNDWAYPGFDPEPGVRSEIEFSLQTVRFNDLLIIREIEAELDSVRVRNTDFSIYRNAIGTSVDIERMAVHQPAAPQVQLRGRFFLREGGSITLAGVRMHVQRSRIEMRGYVELNEGPSVDLDVRMVPLYFEETAAAFGAEVITGSHLTGDVHVSGRPDTLLVNGQVSGDIYDFQLEDMTFNGTYSDCVFDFEHMEGVLNNNQVRGEALFTLPVAGHQFGFEIDGAVDTFNLATFIGEGLETNLSGDVVAYDRGLGQHFILDLGPGTVDMYEFREALGDMNLREDTLLFQGLQVLDDGLDLTLLGVIHPSQNFIDVTANGVSLSSNLFRYFSGDSCSEGELDFESRFVGDLGGPRFELTGRLNGAEYLGIGLDTADLELETDSLTLSPMKIHLEGERVRRFGLDFDQVYVDASALEDTVKLTYVSLDSESGKVVANGTVLPLELPPRTILENLWVRWLGTDWINRDELNIAIADSLFQIAPTRWNSPRGGVEIAWGQTDSSEDRIIFKELDLGQLNPWIPEFLDTDGTVNAELTRLPDGGFSLEASITDALLGGLPAGDLGLNLRWVGDSLFVDQLVWALDGERGAVMRGRFSGMPPASADLGVLGEFRSEELLCDLTIEATNFPVERFESLRADPDSLVGDFTGGIQLSGPLAKPTIASDARLENFRLGTVDLDLLRWTIRPEVENMRISHLEIVRGESFLDGWLVLPLELSILNRPRLRESGEISGDLHLTGRGEDLLGPVWFLAEAEGDLDGDLNLAGSLAQPEATGYIRVRDGMMRLAGWEEKLVDLNADAVFQGDTLQLLSAHSREGLKWSNEQNGEIAGDGWVTWWGPFRYLLRADGTNVAVGTLPFFNGTTSGHIELSTLVEEGIEPHPFVRGDLQVHDGTLSYEFQDPEVAAKAAPTVTPIVSYEIEVKAENNLMLINKQANLELSGELKLVHTPEGQDISGELNTLRGYYTVFGNKYHLLTGNLDFGSAADINPRINILVETRNRRDRIQIEITNTFAEPHVAVVSEEGYSQEDVLRILLGMPVSGEGSNISAEEVVSGRVEAELYNRLERLVSGELAGLVDFELENRNLEGKNEMETRWKIGRYLPGGFYLSYNQGLSLDSDIEVGLEYRLYNRLYLKSEVINRGNQLGEDGLANEYNFDITFRYDY
ncbi:MAG: hypothetical protein GY835_06220 [bacterium]|nr:hypothetical protein [bacterium]